MSTDSNALEEWRTQLSTHGGHLLQSWPWGELKGGFGWTPWRIQIDDASAQVLFRHLPLGQTIAYIPKGPTLNWQASDQLQALFSAIHAEAKKRKAIFLKVEPDIWDSDGSLRSPIPNLLREAGFIPAAPIQPQSSIIVDISGDEDSILAAMKQKTRYNIRLAKKKGVVIREGTTSDISTFYELAQLTSDRDGFGIHSFEYYQSAYRHFVPDHGTLLIAQYEAEPLAALMAFCFGENAYYLYGASANTHRNLMPTYLIQWETIRWAKRQGCRNYDLWGIPTADVEALEAEFKERTDGLWGVYRFKRGFGGRVVTSIGAFDYVYNPLLYKFYELLRRYRKVSD